MIPLPGHTRGHVAIAVREADAGSSRRRLLLPPRPGGRASRCPPLLAGFQTVTAFDNRARLRNAERLRELPRARGRGGVFCAHDPHDLRSSGAGDLARPAGAAGPRGRAALACISRPPPKPTRLPSAPITRWQGSTIANGLRPRAAPTSRTRSSPSPAGECEVLVGGGRGRRGSRSGRQHRTEEPLAGGASGRSNWLRSPAKYSRSCAAARSSGSGSGGLRAGAESDSPSGGHQRAEADSGPQRRVDRRGLAHGIASWGNADGPAS